MIVGLPDHRTLHETAVGWMNLAWKMAIEEAGRFQDAAFLYDEIANEHGDHVAQFAIDKYWRAKQLLLNNAVSLLQQSLEIFLKAMIAEVSPYLLIVGSPSTWPSLDASGCVDFANFRTLDAVQLCRVVNIVSPSALPDHFSQFYDRLRQARNKIIHLDASLIRTEVKTIIIDILTAQKLLFPSVSWVKFRSDYIISAGEYHDKENIFTGDDLTTNVLIHEVNTVIHQIDAEALKTYFSYDKAKKSYRCPHCLGKIDGVDDECEFVQITLDKKLACVVCCYTYSLDEYKQDIIDYFGYLDDQDHAQIRADLKAAFP